MKECVSTYVLVGKIGRVLPKPSTKFLLIPQLDFRFNMIPWHPLQVLGWGINQDLVGCVPQMMVSLQCYTGWCISSCRSVRASSPRIRMSRSTDSGQCKAQGESGTAIKRPRHVSGVHELLSSYEVILRACWAVGWIDGVASFILWNGNTHPRKQVDPIILCCDLLVSKTELIFMLVLWFK